MSSNELGLELYNTFGPKVRNVLDPVIKKINAPRIKYPGGDAIVDYNSEVVPDTYKTDDMVMWTFKVRLIGGPVYQVDLEKIMSVLTDTFAEFEEIPAAIDGRFWTIGDGDDSLAVFFQDGAFCIWVRGWDENPDAE
jgi:hypothetical protein